ncbi:cation diffusion facilitator family transporter [Alteraurantiacibacter aestuarii]|uniref:Cation diffusion facilitator family transporter n=1 Tax=Alteraurantiacibacter aestuarii TaxID=650004 RepID=A0A844ZM31_9SPHN|nr:cation diffusion facilitator family transporter [Alteraurantiacibacter aestuarii]MXO88653.1 cation diffusion facilitator family transporter [Alteraurantiacibacter aestuarii]
MSLDRFSKSALAKSAAFASISVAILLVSLKTWAAWKTGSAAMLGSLADSALDLVASVATLLGVWIAAQPADENHRFGHGKAEALAAMFQVLLITISATGIAYRSTTQLIDGTRIQSAPEGIGVSLIAIVATVALLAWQRFVLARTGSVAIRADHVHYQSDLFLNLSVIAALGLDAYLDIGWADPVFGLAIAAWLIFGAWRASAAGIGELMDAEWPDAKRRAFVERAARHPELSRMHDLRTRSAGNTDFVQFHVDLPGEMTIDAAHDIIARVETDLMRAFPGTEILIHIDPEGHVDEPGNPLVEMDEFDNLRSAQ